MADPSEPKPNEIDADNLSRLLELELIHLEASRRTIPVNSHSRVRFSLCPDRRLLDRIFLCFHPRQRTACKSTNNFRPGSLMSILPRVNYSAACVASGPPLLFARTKRVPVFRSLVTKVLFSPNFDHGPRGTSLKSTNCQSVTSVSLKPR